MKKFILLIYFICLAYPALAAYDHDGLVRQVNIMTTIYMGLVYLLAILYALKKKELYLVGLILMYIIIFIGVFLAFEDITIYHLVSNSGSPTKINQDMFYEYFSKIFLYVILFLPLFNLIFNGIIGLFKKNK